MKTIHNFLKLTTIAAFLVAVSCNNNKTEKVTTETIAITHKLGTTEVPVNPQKVVVYDVGTLETLDELGIPIAGIPKDYVAKHLEKYKDDENVKDAGSIVQPNVELVRNINPDLVVISEVTSREYDDLKKIVPTVYLGVDNENYKTSVIENLNKIGDIFNIKEKTDRKALELENKVDEAVKIITASDKKIMILMYNVGAFSKFGENSRYGFIYTDLKAQPADENEATGIHGTVVSSEYISSVNPDILYIIDRNEIMLGEKTDRKEIENPLIQKTNAYKNNRIIYADPNVWYLSGGGTYSFRKMIDDVLKGYK